MYGCTLARIFLLNKPYQVLCQFTGATGQRNLAEFAFPPAVYPAGRLDYDSEGLLVLTDSGAWQAQISQPRHKMAKVYWAQVEGAANAEALAAIRQGVMLNDGPAQPAPARVVADAEVAGLWPRDPPIRYRAQIPTAWIEITLREGRNRQVRRMTAAVGLPTLRLVRVAVGPWRIDGLAPGEWRELSVDEPVPTARNVARPPTYARRR